MLPQFVDFNADGHIDLFAATFDGTPHVAYGSAAGFLEPEHVLTPDGARVMISQFWNYDESKWDDANAALKGHCTSAYAWDWDADGDPDILMGDYSSGPLVRRMNNGTAAEPRFDGPNIPVEVAGAAFAQEDGLTSHVMVDWNGDGLEDLVTAGYGDVWGAAAGAGVWWYPNTGERGAPKFAAAKPLVPRSKKGAASPTRPDSGIYASVVDWNGDGKLDLLAGGYSNWSPGARPLTAEEEARADALAAELGEHQAALQKLYEKLSDIGDLSEEEQQAAAQAVFESEEYKTLSEAQRKAQAALDELRPRPKREAFVWVYLQEA